MAKQHDCLHEADIATMKEQIDNIFFKQTELIQKVDKAFDNITTISDTLIKMQSYQNIKSWLLYSGCVGLIALCTFLITELYHLKFGG